MRRAAPCGSNPGPASRCTISFPYTASGKGAYHVFAVIANEATQRDSAIATNGRSLWVLDRGVPTIRDLEQLIAAPEPLEPYRIF